MTKDGIEVQVGDWVRHRGTKQWGIIKVIAKVGEESHEIKVERVPLKGWPDTGEGWWAGYHIDRHYPRDKAEWVHGWILWCQHEDRPEASGLMQQGWEIAAKVNADSDLKPIASEAGEFYDICGPTWGKRGYR